MTLLRLLLCRYIRNWIPFTSLYEYTDWQTSFSSLCVTSLSFRISNRLWRPLTTMTTPATTTLLSATLLRPAMATQPRLLHGDRHPLQWATDFYARVALSLMARPRLRPTATVQCRGFSAAADSTPAGRFRAHPGPREFLHLGSQGAEPAQTEQPGPVRPWRRGMPDSIVGHSLLM